MFTKKTNLLHVAIAVILVMAVWFMPFNPLSEIVTVGAESESAPVVGSGSDEIVQFADQKLKNRLMYKDSNNDGELSVAEMETITSFGLYEYSGSEESETISSLDGLEYAINMQEFYVQKVFIEDYSAINDLVNLTKIDIYDTPISDLSFLSNKPNLTHLLLIETELSDISALASLNSLQYVNLTDNKLTSFDALTNLEYLSGLYLENNQITSIPDMSNMSGITLLSLPDNNIETLENIETMPTMISGLDLSGNNISNISALSHFDFIDRIYLSDNNISDISALAKFSTVSMLDLSNNNISDFSAVENMPNMLDLFLAGNNISTIPDLSGMTNLQVLDLSNNNIASIPDLSALEGLLILNMSYNNISSIDSWVQDSQLISIDLTGNQLTEIPNIPNIDYLHLGSNNITDISNLADIIDANSTGGAFDLSNNPITNINVLNDLPRQIPTLNLSNCNISDISYLNNPQVYSLNLSNNDISDISALNNLEYTADLNLSGNKITTTSNITNIDWNSLSILDLSSNQLEDVEFFANLISPLDMGYINLSNNQLTNISPLAEAVSKLTVCSLNFSGNKITDISPIDTFYAGQTYLIYGLNVSDNYLDISEGSNNLSIIEGWQERGIEAIYSDQKTVPTPTPEPTPVPKPDKPEPTPVPKPETKPTPTPVPVEKPETTPAPDKTEQPKTEQGVTIVTNPYSPSDKTYTKPVVQVAETEEELLVDLDQSIPAVVAKMDKTVYSEPVKLSVKPVDTSTEEGKAKLAAVEKEVDRILTLVKAQSGTSEAEEAKIEKVVLLDLSLMTVSSSKSVQPTSGKVTITIPLPDGFDPAKTVIAHAKSDGTVELIMTTVADGWITFEADSFSPFSIMQLSIPAAEVLAAAEAEDDIEIDSDQMQKTGESSNNLWLILPISLLISGALVIRRKLAIADNEKS